MNLKTNGVVLGVMLAISMMANAVLAQQTEGQKPGKPLKVFVLAGQSNMEGHAAVSTIDSIGKDPKTAPILKEMRNPDGSPKVCDRVWISYLTGWTHLGEGYGRLTTGYGARGENPSQPGSEIGPEYTFGIYTEKLLDQPILLIKTAWGGKSLNTDFRSPSAGPYEFNEKVLEQLKKQGRDIDKMKADKAQETGKYYRMMIDHVGKVLKDIKRVYPDYDEKAGYEIAGFIWFQGWNDMCDSWTYPDRGKPHQYDLYSDLLAKFIRDVRKDLDAPAMPFVIGVLGVGGEKEQVIFRKAMAAPAELPEFKGNVTAVETAPFWDYEMEAAQPRQGKYNDILNTAHMLNKDGSFNGNWQWEPYWKAITAPLPQDMTWRYASVDAQQEQDKLKEYTDRRFREIALPPALEKWFTPDFDDSQWSQGKAPIGKGVWKHSGVTLDKFASPWGKEEFLLARTRFEVADLNYAAIRMAILARQGFTVYLNGQRIHRYIWWHDAPIYRSIILTANELKHLKKGTNVLAVYANDQYGKNSPERYAALDLRIEGITRADQERLNKDLEEVLPLKDREILKGASNGGYHYMGSAKIMAQMGKAFAEAVVAMQKK